MTAAAPPRCGHRWHTRHGCAALPEAGVDGQHRCQLEAGHSDRFEALRLDRPHRCGCGATTTREDRP